MKLRSLVDQAKAQVGEAANLKKLEGMRESLQHQLQDKVAVAKTQVAEASVTGKQLLNETRDKLQVALDETQRKATEIAHQAAALIPQVAELEPILKQLGFLVCNIDVTLSVAPSLAVIIEQQEAYVGESLNAMLKERQIPLTNFQDKVLRLLARATDFAASITTNYGYRARQYELVLLPPGVIIHFGPHEPGLVSSVASLDVVIEDPQPETPPSLPPDPVSPPPPEEPPVECPPDLAVVDEHASQ